jgi:hypothetical protein
MGRPGLENWLGLEVGEESDRGEVVVKREADDDEDEESATEETNLECKHRTTNWLLCPPLEFWRYHKTANSFLRLSSAFLSVESLSLTLHKTSPLEEEEWYTPSTTQSED